MRRQTVTTMYNNTYYQRFNTTIESSTEVNNTLTCCISIGGIFSYRTFCILHDTRRKSEHSVTLTAALHKNFVRSEYANSVSQFLLYWMQFICCIYKYFVRQLKAFLPSFRHLCACEMSPEWGHLITWTDPSVGHLNGILARAGGNLNSNFQ